MPSTIYLICGELGAINRSVNWGRLIGPTAPSTVVLVRTVTPLRMADQDARFVWLTASKPRLALSFGATVNKSSSRQSLVGCVPKLPDHWPQVLRSTALPVASTADLRYMVCQGVPR